MFRYVRKRTSASVTWCLPCRRPSVRASAAGCGRRVPQALRHIENLLRQAPQRRVRPRRHRREQEIPQGHRQGRRERKAARLCPVTSHRFPIQDIIIRQQECAILLKASSVEHCCYMTFPTEATLEHSGSNLTLHPKRKKEKGQSTVPDLLPYGQETEFKRN